MRHLENLLDTMKKKTISVGDEDYKRLCEEVHFALGIDLNGMIQSLTQPKNHFYVNITNEDLGIGLILMPIEEGQEDQRGLQVEIELKKVFQIKRKGE